MTSTITTVLAANHTCLSQSGCHVRLPVISQPALMSAKCEPHQRRFFDAPPYRYPHRRQMQRGADKVVVEWFHRISQPALLTLEVATTTRGSQTLVGFCLPIVVYFIVK